MEYYLHYSNGLIACVANKDDPKTIALYLQLYEENCQGGSIIGRLKNVNASNLISYAKRMAHYWYKVLKEKFSKWVILGTLFSLHFDAETVTALW